MNEKNFFCTSRPVFFIFLFSQNSFSYNVFMIFFLLFFFWFLQPTKVSKLFYSLAKGKNANWKEWQMLFFVDRTEKNNNIELANIFLSVFVLFRHLSLFLHFLTFLIYHSFLRSLFFILLSQTYSVVFIYVLLLCFSCLSFLPLGNLWGVELICLICCEVLSLSLPSKFDISFFLLTKLNIKFLPFSFFCFCSLFCIKWG